MPHIKQLTVNNGTADVKYDPAGGDANSTTFVNRGTTLAAVSIITSAHTPSAANALVVRNKLSLNKKKEVEGLTPSAPSIKTNIMAFDLGVAIATDASEVDRSAAYAELLSLLSDPDVKKSIISNEPFFG